jgi:hypothetical protein
MRVFLLLLLLTAQVAHAAPRQEPANIPVTLIYVDVGIPAAWKMLDMAIRAVNVIKGVRLVRGKSLWFDDSRAPKPGLDVDSRAAQRNYWLKKGCKHGERGGLLMIVAPPIHAEGGKWHGGIANGTCTIGDRCAGSVVNVTPTRIFSTLYGAALMAHELGHNLGASHVVDDVIMHPAALDVVDRLKKMPPWGWESAAFISQCVTQRLGHRAK